MTVGELSQLRFLRLEKRLLQKDLADVDRRLTRATYLEREALADLRPVLAERLRRVERELEPLESFIRDIKDPYTRQLFVARYVTGKTWAAISLDLGGYVGEDALKKVCYRYLDRAGEK